MKRVAKLVIVDDKNMYLMMYRSDHPMFAMDSDLPGGTVEDGESAIKAMAREVVEEAGVHVDYSMYLFRHRLFQARHTLHVVYR